MAHDLNILVACFPKSGSTFLSAIVANLPGMRRARIVPGFDRREQEIDPAIIVQERALTQRLGDLAREGLAGLTTPPLGFVAQHHVKFSAVTQDVAAAEDLRVVVQTRNLFDALVSLDDHLCKGPGILPMAWVPEDFSTWDRPRRFDFLVACVAPWYIGFYVSWAGRSDALRCDYSALRADPAAEVARLMGALGSPISDATAQTAVKAATQGKTRLNVGIDGRGTAFCAAQCAQIKHMTAFYPDIDFGPIGL